MKPTYRRSANANMFKDFPLFEAQKQLSFSSAEALVNDRKFNTAIRRSTLEQFKKRCNAEETTLDDKIILEHMLKRDISLEDLKIDQAVYSRWLLPMINRSNSKVSYSRQDSDLIDRIWTLTAENLDAQYAYSTSNSDLLDHNNLMKYLKTMLETYRPDSLTKNLTIASIQFAIVLEKLGLLQGVRRSSKTYEEYIETVLPITEFRDESICFDCFWSQNLCCINLEGLWYLLPRPYILMFHNKVADLISVKVFSKMSSIAMLEQHFDAFVTDLVKELCRLNIRYQVKFYDIAKTLEALVTGESLLVVDAWVNDDLYQQTVEQLHQDTGFDYNGSRLKMILTSCDIPGMHELGCLSKIVGHPLVDMFGGVQKLHETTTETYQLSTINVAKTSCYIMKNYIRNHIYSRGVWPPCNPNTPNIHPALLEAWKRNIDPYCLSISEKFGTPDILEYLNIDLQQNMKYEYLENVIPYLKDKTISLLRSKVVSKYINKSIEISETQPEKSDDTWKETRLLLYYLMTSTKKLNHVAYIDKYNTSNSLEEVLDYLVIKCVPKEKELKVKPRFFGCRTYEDRFRCLSQEKTAMKFLELYSDDQAMTLSELELSRRLLAFRRLHTAYKDHYIIYAVLDAKNWNSHFRSQTVDPPMKRTLDPITGMNVYGFTGISYEHVFYYTPDGQIIYFWDGQGGGIEGQNQDTWVIVYIGQIKIVLDGLKIPYFILVRGDDVRIALCIPKSTIDFKDLPKYKNDLIRKLSEVLGSLGHVIKIEESYGSARYFAFSKEVSVGNICLSQGLRKIMKVHGYNNAFMAFLDDLVASTYSNAHSACKVSPVVLPAEATGMYWMFYYLLQHPSYRQNSNSELIALTLTPSVVGGLPMIYHHNMYVRAESDLLAPFISMIQFMDHYNPLVANAMRGFCKLPTKLPTTCERVYRDPYAIATSQPSLPTSILRSQIVPMLQKITVNEDVRELLKAASSVSSKKFIECLDSSNILSPRVFAALYAASPLGLLQELTTKFETARSVLQVLILGQGKYKSQRVIKRLVQQDTRLQNWRSLSLKGRTKGEDYSWMITSDACPAQIANKLREMSWGKPVESVTMAPLQHQVYLTTPDNGGQDEHSITSHFTVNITSSKDTVCKDQRPHYSEGGKNPFIGYTTRTGTIEPMLSFVEKDMMLVKLQNLIELASWTNQVGIDHRTGEHVSSNMYELIANLVLQYTDMDMSKFTAYVGQKKSGTQIHHIRCPGFRESIVVNLLSNLMTHVTGESDTNLRISKSKGLHYKINFLHMYVYTACSFFMSREIYTTPLENKELWCVLSKCAYCLEPIVETPIVIDTSILNELDFAPLKMTRVHNNAMELILESLEINKDIKFLDEGDLEVTLDLAVEGIMCEIMEMTYYGRRNLQDRYTQHSLDKDAKRILSSFAVGNCSKDIGVSELKYLPSYLLTNALMNCIMYSAFQFLNWRGAERFTHYMTMVPVRELPWYDMVQKIFSWGKMANVVNYISATLGRPLLGALHSVESCTIALGTEALLRSHMYVTNSPIVVISNYVTNKIVKHVSRQIYCKMRHFHRRHYHEHLAYVRNTRDELNENEEFLMVIALIFTLVPFNKVEAYTLQITDTSERIVTANSIIDTDVVEVCEQLTMMDEDELSEEGIDFNWFRECLDLYNISLERVVDAINKFGAMDINENIYLTLENYKMDIVVTTLSDCISRVRQEVAEEPPAYIPNEISASTNIFTHKIRQKKSRIRLLPSVDQESWISNRANINMAQFPPRVEQMRYPEILSRPYGSSNCSSSTLVYILKVFHVMTPKNDVPINSVHLADGLGGMAMVAAAKFQQSHIYFSTLHIEHGPRFVPADLMTVANATGCIVDFSSIQVGMTDLTRKTVTDYMKNKVTHNVQLFTCDVEIFDTTMSVDNIYRNTLDFYLTSRGNTSVFVHKINLTFDRENIWFLHNLSHFCESVYLVHPPTLRCHLVSYVVCIGRPKNVYTGNLSSYPMMSYSLPIVNVYNKFKADRLHNHMYQINQSDKAIPYINGAVVADLRVNDILPPLFVTLMQPVLGIHPDHVVIDELKLISPKLDDYYSQCRRKFFKDMLISSRITEYKNHLREGKAMTIYGQCYNLNTATHRVIMVKRLFALRGFVMCTEYYTNGKTPVQSLETLKRDYLKRYFELHRRDQYPDHVRCHWNTKIVIDGLDMSYYTSYIQGYNIGLAFVAYFRTQCEREGKHDSDLMKVLGKAIHPEYNDVN